MNLRFKSAPLGQDGTPILAEVQEHTLELTTAKCYGMAAWTGGCFFFVTCSIALIAAAILRKLGYDLIAEADQICLSLLLGLASGLTAFCWSHKTELDFQMQMKTLADRNLDWGDFRVFDLEKLRGPEKAPMPQNRPVSLHKRLS